LFCFLICFFPPTNTFKIVDLISCDLHEREILYGKLRSQGNPIQEQPQASKQQGTLHYEIHMRILLLLLPSNHIMILWKEFCPIILTTTKWHQGVTYMIILHFRRMPIMHKYMLV
jgi:hypothetical protein